MSRSLGTLTLDLVAKTAGFIQGMDKSERASKKWRKQVERDMEQVKAAAGVGLAAVAAGAAVASAALVGLTKKGLESVDAQAKFARSLDTTYDSVSALSLAFSDSGIDGWERSVSRLNRRLGAAEKDMGPAVKTVEALNLNLSELSSMEADQRVAAIADAIKDSGVSAQMAARMAQDLGFEQREAAAMFMAGGGAIRGYREEIKALGLSMSELDSAKVEAANDAFARIGRIFDGLSQQLAVEIAPLLHAISDLLVENAKEAGGFGDAITSAFDGVIGAAGFAADAVEGVKRVSVAAGSSIAVGWLAWQKVILETANVIVNGPVEAITALLELIDTIPGVEVLALPEVSGIGRAIRDELKITDAAISAGLEDIEAELLKPMPSQVFKKFVKEAREAGAIASQAITGLGGGSISDADADEKARKAFEEHLKQLDKADKARHEWRMELVDAEMAQREEMENARLKFLRRIRAEEEAQLSAESAVLDSLRTEQEEIAALYEERAAIILASTRMTEEEKTRIMMELAKQRDDQLEELEAMRISTTLQNYQGLFDGLAGLSEAFAGQQSGVYKAMFAVSKAFAIADSIVKITQGIANAAALPFPANLGAMATVGAATAGLVSNIQQTQLSFEGGGFTGYGARTGGVDGHGGFPAILHPNETVIDHTQGGMGVTVNLIEDNSKAGRVDQNRRDDGSTEINIFVADIMSGGPRAKALQNAYGLRRQGK